MSRKLSDIAKEIINDMAAQSQKVPWQQKFCYAKPYVMAMRSLDSISDNYGLDSGRSIVLYFLANASTWKGETARRIKKELNELVK